MPNANQAVEQSKYLYYIGVKIVKGRPAKNDRQMGAYPPGSDGYEVTYEDGYVTWSPKAVFEKFYLEMGLDPSKVTEKMVNEFITDLRAKTLDDEKTLFLEAQLRTGFTQYETSSCVDPINYDPTIGKDICLKRVKNTVWMCLGFLVQWARFGLSAKKNNH